MVRLSPSSELARHLLLAGGMVLLVLGSGYAFPGYLTQGHLTSLIELASILAIVSAGQTLVVLTAGIDLSVASIMNVVVFAVTAASERCATSSLAPVAVGLAVGAALGALNGIAVAILRLHPLIATLATATILYGTVMLATGGSAASADNDVVAWLGNARIAGVPADIFALAAVTAFMAFVLRATNLGVYVLAIGSNERAARIAEVPIRTTLVAVYALSGLMSALTGVILLGYSQQAYIGVGTPYILLSIAAVAIGGTSILGGRGGYMGTILGALLLTGLSATTTMADMTDGQRQILFGITLLLILATDRRRHA